MKKLFHLFLISLFWGQVIYANPLQVICFSSEVNLKAAKSHSLTILAKRDKVFIRESNHCLEFKVSPSRVELLTKWIERRFKILNHYREGSGSTSNVKIGLNQLNGFETCNLSIVEEKQASENVKEFSMGENSKLSETVTKSTGGRKSSLLLGVGSQGSITVNDTRVELTCLKAGARYNVRVNLAGLNSAIATQVQVMKGARVNLGSVVEDLNSRTRETGLNKGLKLQKKKGVVKKSYFLMAN